VNISGIPQRSISRIILLPSLLIVHLSTMKILTPETLEENGYQLHERLKHTELMAFVSRYFFKKNPVMYFYWIFNIVTVIGGFVLLFLSPDKIGPAMSKFCQGIAAFFLLIPIPELIHGIGYRLSGAKNVSYKAVWKQLVFYAMADRFVARGWPFVLTALAPFAILNTVCIVLFFTLPPLWNWLAFGALVMHTAGCSGDFALISYFYTYRKSDPVTYDDVAGEESFFYLKNT